MRFAAILEMYGSTDVSSMSIWNDLHHLLDGLNADRPAFCEWLVPKRGKMTWPERYFNRPWIHLVPALPDPLGAVLGPHSHTTAIPIETEAMQTVSPKRGHLIIDFVLNRKYLHSGALNLGMWVEPSQYTQALEIPVVNWATGTTRDIRNRMLASKAGRALAVAAMLTGPTICLNEFDRGELVGMAREFLHPRHVAEISERIYVTGPASDFGPVDAMFERYERERLDRMERHHATLVFHGGQLDSRRRLPECVDAIAYAVQQGQRVTARFTTQHAPKDNPFGERVWLSTNMNHRDYIEALGQGDILYIGCVYISTGQAYLEAIRSGMIPIVYDAFWMAPFLPAGYPYVCDKKADLGPMLTHMLSAYAGIRAEWQQKLIRHLDGVAPIVVGKKFRTVMQKILDPYVAKNAEVVRSIKPAFPLLEHAVQEERWPEITSADTIYDALAHRSRTGTAFKFVSPLALRWMLMALGYVDRCDRPGLSLVRTQA